MQLTKQTGYLVEVKRIKSRWSNSIKFRLSNQKEFLYDGILPSLDDVYNSLNDAEMVSVYVKADEIWKLDIDGQTILSEVSALKARQSNGQYGLVSAFIFLLFDIVFFGVYLNLRAKRKK